LDNLETLIEAVEYAEDIGMNWWDVFETVDDARKTLTKAAKEQPDEYQVAKLAEILDEDIYEVSQVGAFRNCMKKLRKQLRSG
jgi:MoaA/NifB/PqqE/SkfB family radical SAM enzyme